jgi:hypothetical protein
LSVGAIKDGEQISFVLTHPERRKAMTFERKSHATLFYTNNRNLQNDRSRRTNLPRDTEAARNSPGQIAQIRLDWLD